MSRRLRLDYEHEIPADARDLVMWIMVDEGQIA